MMKQLLLIALGVGLGATGHALARHDTKDEPASAAKPKVLLEQVLTEKLDDKEAKITVLLVEKAPGAATAKHRHPGPVVGYVLEGELESQVEGQPLRTYKKGDVFFEPARSLHAVSRNPSKTSPVRFLAFFLTAKDEKELVLPEKP